MTRGSYANSDVLAFYRQLPFNFYGEAAEAVARIRKLDPIAHYPPLKSIVRPGMRVLDIGCGAGWFVNGLAHHYRIRATGLDFNAVALEQGREIARALSNDVELIEGDLFLYQPDEPYDLVTSLGVLHHTDDCLAGLRYLGKNLVKPGGHLFVGLYHAHGRRPLLDHFAKLKAAGAGEEELYRAYRELDSRHTDEVHARSWFRDQVLHPHETQHTLEEVVPVLEESGLALQVTSINRFGPIESLEALYRQEADLAAVGQRYLDQHHYFPGFFVFLAVKNLS